MGKTPRRGEQIQRDEPLPFWHPLRYAPVVFYQDYRPDGDRPEPLLVTNNMAAERAAKILSTDFLKYHSLMIGDYSIAIHFDILGRFVNREPADRWYEAALRGHPLDRDITIDVNERFDHRGWTQHPNPFDPDSPELDGALRELLIRAREVVWETLVDYFNAMVCLGACRVFARVGSRLEPQFTEVPAFTLREYKMNWSKGIATADNDRLYDIHVASAGKVEEEEVASPGIDGLHDVRVASEPTDLENRIWDAIEAIDPKLTKFSRAELFQKIGEWCKDKVLQVPSQPVFTRAIRKLRENRIWDAIEVIGPDWTELSPTGLIQRIGEWCKEKGFKVPREPAIKSAIEKLRKAGRV